MDVISPPAWVLEYLAWDLTIQNTDSSPKLWIFMILDVDAIPDRFKIRR